VKYSSGGAASSSLGFISRKAGSTGLVDISGAGAHWTVSDSLYVGGGTSAAGGTATLNVSAGGLVSAKNQIKIWPSAVVNVGDGMLQAGTINNLGVLNLGSDASVSAPPGASLVFNNLSQLSQINKIDAGDATLAGALTSNTGSISVSEGRLILSGGGTANGKFSVAAGATAEFAGGNYVLNGALASGGGTWRVSSGSVTFGLGGMQLPGTLEVDTASVTSQLAASLGALQLHSNTHNSRGYFSNGVTTVQGAIDWTGGTLGGPGTVVGNSTILIHGSDPKALATTLNNKASALWTDDSQVRQATGGVFNNLPGATFTARHPQTNGSFPSFDAPVFNNHGTFISDSATRVVINSAFNNDGLVQLRNGDLQFNGNNGISSGSYQAAVGTKLLFGDYSPIPHLTFTASSTIHSAGDVQFAGFPIDFAGTYDVSGETSVGGLLNFQPTAQLVNIGSKVTVHNTLNFSTGKTITLPQVELVDFGQISGTDNVIFNGALNWNAGGFSGSGKITLAGATVINGATSVKKIDGTTVENMGTITWNDSPMTSTGGVLINRPGGTIALNGVAAYQGTQFINEGLLTSNSASAANPTILANVTNTGTIEVQSGKLTYYYAQGQTGSIKVASGATLAMQASVAKFAASSQISGAGNVEFDNVTLDVEGRYDVSGITRVGTQNNYQDITTLNFKNGANVVNIGSLLSIDDYGTVNFNTGSTVHLHNVYVGGETNYGKLGGSDPIVIDGTLSGKGVVQTNLNVIGQMSPGNSPGTITVAGNYIQGDSGSLIMEITRPDLVGGAGSHKPYTQQFDSLVVNSKATLAGTLDLRMLDGFTPQGGQQFPIMSFSSRAGYFSEVTGWAVGNGLVLEPVYGATGITLVAHSAQTRTWTGGNGSWGAGFNWSGFTGPGFGDHVQLTQSGVTSKTISFTPTSGPPTVLSSLHINAAFTGGMTLSQTTTDPLSVLDEYVGETGKGSHVQSNGVTTIANALHIGYAAGGSGTYSLSGAGALVVGDEFIGESGTGAFGQSGGAHTVQRTLSIAAHAGSSGIYTMSGGTLSAGTILNNGSFLQTGGSASAGSVDGSGSMSVGPGATFVADRIRQHALTLSGSVSIVPGGASGGANVLDSLTLSSNGTIDLADGALIIKSDAANRLNALAQITGALAAARGKGDWSGNGLSSSTAAADPKRITGLAVILNDDGAGNPIHTDFDGQTVGINDVIVKYTYNGDMDLTGKVDADDYFLIDRGFATHLTGYRNGDLDLNGIIDADDYFLIDNAFVNQTGVLGLDVPASAAAVPEPFTIGLLAVGLPALFSRRCGPGVLRRRATLPIHCP
jgi:T5SS/PEP-CTERM-associated repeat protein